MSDEKKIEKLVGDAMENYRVPPPAAAKDAIRQKLKEKRLLKGIWGAGYLSYFIIAGVIAALIPAAMYLNSLYHGNSSVNTVASTNKTNSAVQVSTEKNISSQQNGINKNVSTTINTANEKPQTTTPTTINELSTDNINQPDEPSTKNTSTQTTAFKHKPSQLKEILADKKNKNSAEKVMATPNNTKQALPSPKTKNMDTETTEAKAAASPSDIKPDDSRAVLSPSDTKPGESKSEPTTTDNQTKEPSNNSSSQKNNLNEYTSTPSSSSLNAVTESSPFQTNNNNQSNSAGDSVTTPPTASVATNLATTPNNVQDSAAKPDTTVKNPAQHKVMFSVDIYSGPQFNSINFDASSQPYFDAMKHSEKTTTAFGGGVLFNVQLNHIIIEAGFQSTALKTKFSKSQSTTSVDTSGSHYNYTDTTVVSYDSTNSDTIYTTYHIDSTWMSVHDTSITSKTTSSSNKVSYFEVPLLVGYQFAVKKFDIELKAGASVSLLSSVKATLISPVDGSINDFTKSNSPYRKSYWSFLAAANVDYNFSRRFAVFLQPRIKSGLGSIYKAGYPVSGKIRTFAINLGIRIHF